MLSRNEDCTCTLKRDLRAVLLRRSLRRSVVGAPRFLQENRLVSAQERSRVSLGRLNGWEAGEWNRGSGGVDSQEPDPGTEADHRCWYLARRCCWNSDRTGTVGGTGRGRRVGARQSRIDQNHTRQKLLRIETLFEGVETVYQRVDRAIDVGTSSWPSFRGYGRCASASLSAVRSSSCETSALVKVTSTW